MNHNILCVLFVRKDPVLLWQCYQLKLQPYLQKIILQSQLLSYFIVSEVYIQIKQTNKLHAAPRGRGGPK